MLRRVLATGTLVGALLCAGAAGTVADEATADGSETESLPLIATLTTLTGVGLASATYLRHRDVDDD